MARYNRASEMAEKACIYPACVESHDRTVEAAEQPYSASHGILDNDISDALDSVNPAHYTRLSPEPIDVIESWGLNYHEGTILKYLSRWKNKNGVEDLKKARWFLERLIERESSKDL